MRSRSILATAWLLPLAGFFFAAPQPCDGCAGVGPRPIVIAEESALIIWDAATKTEHFIRRAIFKTDNADFGFLVPTQPKLSEAKDETFTRAESWTQAKRATRFKYEPFICMFFTFGAGATAKADGVRILDAQHVAGQDAVVLEADDAGALAKWLINHGYPSSPELASWLGPYIAQKWKVTAFKFAQDPKSGNNVEPAAVRMSFTTEKPFFPYREPEEAKEKERPVKEKDTDGRDGRRVLRVLFVGAQRMKGEVSGKPWYHRNFADKLSKEERSELLKLTGLQDAQIPSTAWMTVFEDESSPRAGRDEVYFFPDEEQTPIIHRHFNVREIWIPLDAVILVALMLLAGLGMFLLRRSKKLPAA